MKCAGCQHVFTVGAQPAVQSAQPAAGGTGKLSSQPGLFPDTIPAGPDPLANHIIQDPGFADVDLDEIRRTREAEARKGNKLANAYSTSSSLAKMDDEEQQRKANAVLNVGYLSPDTLFGFDGRINRKKFWLSSLFFGMISVVVTVVLLFGYSLILYAADIDLPEPGSRQMWDSLGVIAPIFFVMFFTGVLSSWVSFALMAKRYHDLGYSGYRSLLSFIPIVGAIWVIVELGFFPGDPKRNHYGINPLSQPARRAS